MMEQVITDKTGRRITLRRVGVLEQLRMVKALGSNLADNQPYMRVAILAAHAEMIDDIPLPFPVDEGGVEALLERLGDDGMTALWINKNRVEPKTVEEAAGN
jgi:hypothetical protein